LVRLRNNQLIGWFLNYRNKRFAKTLIDINVIYWGTRLIAGTVEHYTGDNSLDTLVDMTAPLTAGFYLFRRTNHINNGILKDSARFLTAGGIGFVIGDELMAHQVERGIMDVPLDITQNVYSNIKYVLPKIKNVPGALGGILGATSYVASQFKRGYSR